MNKNTDKARKLFAGVLRKYGETGFANIVEAGVDNSHGGLAAIEAIEAATNTERERCAKIADEMRDKHGSPIGDAYSNGVWDQSVRIAQKIREPDNLVLNEHK